MAKVRVPKEHRPPSRFGEWAHDKGLFRVSGIYRNPRKGEIFWDWLNECVSEAQFDFDWAVCVILERVK